LGSNGHPQWLVGPINAALRDGATLVVDSVERLHEPVYEFCLGLEQVFGVPLQADLYASWRDGPARELQWNDHEAIVLHLHGTKGWRVSNPTAFCPSIKAPPQKPVGAPAWAGDLEAGDLLYIPRGWWYADSSFGQPALYLVVTFKNPTGLDIMHRLVETLSMLDFMRMDIPRFSGASVRSSYLRLIQLEIVRAMATPGLVLGVQREMQERTDARTYFSFPLIGDDAGFGPLDNHSAFPLVHFPANHVLRRVEREDATEIAISGQVSRLSQEAVWVLEQLSDQSGRTVRSLREAYSSQFGTDIAPTLSELLRCGAISLRIV